MMEMIDNIRNEIRDEWETGSRVSAFVLYFSLVAGSIGLVGLLALVGAGFVVAPWWGRALFVIIPLILTAAFAAIVKRP